MSFQDLVLIELTTEDVELEGQLPGSISRNTPRLANQSGQCNRTYEPTIDLLPTSVAS